MSRQGSDTPTANGFLRKSLKPAPPARNPNAFDSLIGGLSGKPLPKLSPVERMSGSHEVKDRSGEPNNLKRRADDELPKSPKKVKKVEENVLKRRAPTEALQPSKKQKTDDSATSTSTVRKSSNKASKEEDSQHTDHNTNVESRKKAIPKKRIHNRTSQGPTPPDSSKGSSSPASGETSKKEKKSSASTAQEAESAHSGPAAKSSEPSKKRKRRVVESDDEDDEVPIQLPSPPSADVNETNEQIKKRKVSDSNDNFKPKDVYKKINRKVFQGTPTIPEMHALNKFKLVETVRAADLKNFLGLHAPSSLKGHGKATKEELQAMVVKYLVENPLKIVKPKPVSAPKIGLFADENKLKQLNNLPACRYKKSRPAVTPSQPPKPVIAPVTSAFLPGVLLAMQPSAPPSVQPQAQPASQAFQPSWERSTSASTFSDPSLSSSDDANHHHQTATHYCRNCCRDFDCRHPAHRAQASRR